MSEPVNVTPEQAETLRAAAGLCFWAAGRLATSWSTEDRAKLDALEDLGRALGDASAQGMTAFGGAP